MQLPGPSGNRPLGRFRLDLPLFSPVVSDSSLGSTLCGLPIRCSRRQGLCPSGPGWSYELKWDGFRAIVSTEDGLRVRSRRGWNMTPVLPELRSLPTGLVLDGELVAWQGEIRTVV